MELARNEAHYRRELGDNLVLRWSTADDMDRLVDLYSFVFREGPEDPPNTRVAGWVRDMGSDRHPLIGSGDYALVEDSASGKIVAATCLMQMPISFEDIPLSMGRPEVVATLPEYRQRGLVRAIFELVHERSAARGDLVQGITGISYYYRQFGYEYAVELGGSRSVYFSAIPKAKEGEAEPFRLRASTIEDLPWLERLYERERRLPRNGHAPMLSTPFHPRFWAWTMTGQHSDSSAGWTLQVVLDREDQPKGYVKFNRTRYNEGVQVYGMAFDEGVNLQQALPPVLRAIRAGANEFQRTAKADTPQADRIALILGSQHPIYDLLGQYMVVRPVKPYAWYIRVADLPAFLQRIAPVLERRLAASPLAGYSGELKFDFFRSGLKLIFENGRLKESSNWNRNEGWQARSQATFPPNVFLQLLFGHRSMQELEHSFPDVEADGVGLLLDTLFPKRYSWMIELN